jgi:membrane protein DedA with SNARE-associated domain
MPITGGVDRFAREPEGQGVVVTTRQLVIFIIVLGCVAGSVIGVFVGRAYKAAYLAKPKPKTRHRR